MASRRKSKADPLVIGNWITAGRDGSRPFQVRVCAAATKEAGTAAYSVSIHRLQWSSPIEGEQEITDRKVILALFAKKVWIAGENPYSVVMPDVDPNAGTFDGGGRVLLLNDGAILDSAELKQRIQIYGSGIDPYAWFDAKSLITPGTEHAAGRPLSPPDAGIVAFFAGDNQYPLRWRAGDYVDQYDRLCALADSDETLEGPLSIHQKNFGETRVVHLNTVSFLELMESHAEKQGFDILQIDTIPDGEPAK